MEKSNDFITFIEDLQKDTLKSVRIGKQPIRIKKPIKLSEVNIVIF